MQDLLQMAQNSVTYTDSKVIKTHLLEDEDPFWATNSLRPFPDAVKAIETELKEYTTASKGITDLNKTGADAREGTDTLANALGVLPEMQKRKKTLDTHMLILHNILDQLKARKIDEYFSLESGALSGSIDQAVFQNQISPQGKGTIEDKLRLFLMYYLVTDIDPNELKSLTEVLLSNEMTGKVVTSASSVRRALASIRQLKSDNAIANGDIKKLHKHVAIREASSGMWGKLVDNFSTQGRGLMVGVRNLVTSNDQFPLTQLVDALLSNNDTGPAAKYEYLDPKSSSKNRGPMGPSTAKDAVVFVLGGGCYAEARDLLEYSKKNSSTVPRNILYGSTEILSPLEFLAQVTALGVDS